MFVVTTDQRGSTRTGDRVPALLDRLTPWRQRWAPSIVLPLVRTVGDEVQVLVSGPDAAVDLALLLIREQQWSVGVGAGSVDEPLGATARESSGAAFVHARRAVERARGRGEPVPVVVAGSDPDAEEEATAILQLLGSVVARRSAAGWEVADHLVDGATQREVAEALRISPQAVSKRVAAGLIEEERRARPVAARMLARLERLERSVDTTPTVGQDRPS
ncbi:hypothetical protein [Demequina globuliformis]|uniref:hypothetical protein n=1 Tax=Demequina globuliformis TaxID=676202 RepID=UPI000781A180|nr:hypothetical protein [Demequina globuliformis]